MEDQTVAAEATQQAQDTSAESTAPPPEPGSEGQAEAAPAGKLFTQADVDRIVERRLARERRQWERRMQEELEAMRRQLQQPAPQDIDEQNRQFLAEFSRNPLQALRRFAQSFVEEQNRSAQSVSQAVQQSAQEAVEMLAEEYPDFRQYSAEAFAYLQADPGLSALLRAAAANPSPEAFAGLLRAAYWQVRNSKLRQAGMVASAQIAQEAQAMSAAKRQAAVPAQRVTPKQPTTEDVADVLFQAMRGV